LKVDSNVVGLTVTVGIELLRTLQKRLDQLAGIVTPGLSAPPPPPASAAADAAADTAPTPPNNGDEYARLKQRIEACEAELEQQTHVESATKLTEWNERIRELRKSIRASKSLTDEQREHLDVGVLSLRVDLMSLGREPASSAKRSRAKTAAAPVPSAAPNSDETEVNP
jgi:hypothetical protein